MPFAINRDYRIHYTIEGSGPLVVLQHGLLSSGESWKEAGYVDSLTESFTVACLDSLGHGQSDKPIDAQAYRQSQRAADIVAVMDHIGADKAHLIGYSMGGWMSVGVARYFPERLDSLVIGGWDCVNGMSYVSSAMGIEMNSIDQLLTAAEAMAPDLVAWVTPEIRPALGACFNALAELDGASDAVCGLNAPVTLWDGTEDPYHDPMKAFAAENGLGFISTSGDHLGAMINNAPEHARAFQESILKGTANA